MSISFEQLLRLNVLQDVGHDLDVLSDNAHIEHEPDDFFESEAITRNTDVNNLMCVESLAGILRDLGFSNEASRLLASEMIRRRLTRSNN